MILVYQKVAYNRELAQIVARSGSVLVAENGLLYIATHKRLFQEKVARGDCGKRINKMIRFLESSPCTLTEYEEIFVRILVERITGYDDHIKVDVKSQITVDIQE